MPHSSAWRLHSSAFLIALLSLILVGCADGPGGGIGGTGKKEIVVEEGLIFGRVEGFGSIVLNNLRFNTDNAEFLINGEPARISDMKVGMSIFARVNYRTMAASQVHYQPIVVGPISNGDTDGIEVLKQNIKITDDTVFDELLVESLTEGTNIEVSGTRDSSNAVVADYIGLATDADTTYTVGQVISTQVENNVAFVSGTLFSANEINAEPGEVVRADVANGLVEVECTYEKFVEELVATFTGSPYGLYGPFGPFGPYWPPANPVYELQQLTQLVTGTCLVASSIIDVNRPPIEANDNITLSGIVSVTPDGNTIISNHFLIQLDDDTELLTKFEIPIADATLVNDEPVLIEGTVVDEATVLADRIVLLSRD